MFVFLYVFLRIKILQKCIKIRNLLINFTFFDSALPLFLPNDF